MNTCEWLDRVKKENQIVSDYKLSKMMGISPTRISNYRTNKSQMDDDLALQVENLLKLPPGSVLLDMHAERTKCTQAAAVLREIAKQMTATAAAFILALTTTYAIMSPAPAMAFEASELPNNVYYVKSELALIFSDWESLMLFFTLFVVIRLILSYILRFSLRRLYS